MFKFVFLYVMFFGSDYLVNTHEVVDLDDSKPEDIPFQAVVHARRVCGGVLVTENYVLAPAYCVYGSTNATVYLGFQGYPYYMSHHSEPNTQILQSIHIFIHEDFAKITDQHYLNNIALIKLSTPATLNNKVYPGKLMSRQETQFLEGRFANVTGWLVSLDTNIKLATVQIRNQDTCDYLYGDRFLRSQEYCVKWSTKSRLNLLGNPVTVDNKIVGFQTNTPTCAVASSSCSRNDMVLSFIPFLGWMSHNMDIPIEQFTVKSQEDCCTNHDLSKIEDLINEKVNEAINKEINSKKYESDIVNINAKIKNILDELQIIKSTQNNFELSLNEQIGSVKTEMSNGRVGIEQNILQLQEEVNGVRAEVTGGLIAQRSLNDSEARFIEINKDLQTKVGEQINKLDEEIKELINTTKHIKIIESEHYLIHHKKIAILQEKLDHTNVREIKNQDKVDEQLDHINNLIKDVLSVQDILRLDTEVIKKDLTSNILDAKVHTKELEEKIDEILIVVNKNKQEGHLRFAEIKKVFGEQRNDMDKHIIQEVTKIHLLWSEVKSLNNSVNELLEYVYNAPILS